LEQRQNLQYVTALEPLQYTNTILNKKQQLKCAYAAVDQKVSFCLNLQIYMCVCVYENFANIFEPNSQI